MCALLVFILHPSSFVLAQETTAPPANRGVQLLFAPPPMEGTISMGVYDSTGKLVRVLHQDAPATDFFPALNGLITFWNGKDDSGNVMPAGKYHAKGYMMGEMDFEGVAYLGNDWITDEKSRHIRHIDSIDVNDYDQLDLTSYETPGGLGAGGSGASDIPPPKPINITARIDGGKLLIKSNGIEKTIPLSDGETATDASAGFGDTAWAIIKTNAGSEVRAYSAAGEFIRRLAIAPEAPQPTSIKASRREEQITLLEENAKMQRVRTLQLLAAAPAPSPAQTPPADAQAVSTWKVVFDKAITFSDKIDQVRDLLKMSDGKPFVPQGKITLHLRPNPLDQDKQGAVDIGIAIDDKGSFLKAADGLPLCRVSETPNLKWAAMAREADAKTITIFQSDGAVVEQFKVSKLGNMAAFDAGDFDFDPAKMK